MSTIEAYEEVCAELWQWEDELTIALEDMANLHKSVANVCAMHALSTFERDWVEKEFSKIDERIDGAESRIAELERYAVEMEREFGFR